MTDADLIGLLFPEKNIQSNRKLPDCAYIHREMMEVDWAGKTASITDNVTGEPIPAYIFVAVLSCSQYAYVETFLTMNMESWIKAHVNTFNYFGGVTRILMPDNLKTSMDKVSRPDPKINKTYHEMAEHYGTAVIPAKVGHPKDYLQNRIIFKITRTALAYSRSQHEIEDNNVIL